MAIDDKIHGDVVAMENSSKLAVQTADGFVQYQSKLARLAADAMTHWKGTAPPEFTRQFDDVNDAITRMIVKLRGIGEAQAQSAALYRASDEQGTSAIRGALGAAPANPV